ncbi:MAG TPA: DNA-formamidopyrimidine glycosylase family protein [Gemmatimonadales bacterium]|jgi:formamidopyrimidine-DNA glycosylase|nr:DNA-formamidopyrimidine glycosylase family protein [Gemmatimonadales bacterium]
MPELPDITIYLEALAPRIVGQPLERARIVSPSLLRTVEPPLSAAERRKVVGLRRLGKRIVWEMEGDIFLVFHLMIAGRFKWRPEGTKPPAKVGLASFDFPTGTLLLTEASSKKRASLYVVEGETNLTGHDPGGLDVLAADLPAFKARLQSESHTLKRALTDPHLFDGIGNWLSDEILHAAKLSLFQLTTKLNDEEIERLYDATRATTRFWIDRLRAETGTKFPEKVSAFKEGMAVHGRYKQPCPVCGSPVQRIRYADNEANYCATCQTGGRVLADRSLSRLLKADWPRSLEEWEAKLGR